MIAHFDCIAGASGDMLLAALLDAGAGIDAVTKHVEQLGLGAVQITVDEIHRRGIRATKVSIGGDAEIATYSQVRILLEGSTLDASVKSRALAVFKRLAEAESRIHGVTVDEVHFHELSAIDTIVDVVAVCAALHELGVERCTSSPIPTGWGMVATQHGQLPVPAPAVLELLKDAELRQVDILAELVTPTGAAIIAEVAESFGPMPSMSLGAVGYGAGSAELEIPNVVRVVLGEPVAGSEELVEEVLLEANIDDMNPELYEYVSARLFEAGADDVWIVPATGKKGRPINIISVLAPPAAASALRHLLVKETSTIGVRTTTVGRFMLDREWEQVEVSGHQIRVKVARDGGTIVNVAPEYEDCVRLATATGLALKEVFRLAGGRLDDSAERREGPPKGPA